MVMNRSTQPLNCYFWAPAGRVLLLLSSVTARSDISNCFFASINLWYDATITHEASHGAVAALHDELKVLVNIESRCQSLQGLLLFTWTMQTTLLDYNHRLHTHLPRSYAKYTAQREQLLKFKLFFLYRTINELVSMQMVIFFAEMIAKNSWFTTVKGRGFREWPV